MSKKTVAALRIAALVLCLGVAAYFVTMIALGESANWFGLIAPILSSIALVMLLKKPAATDRAAHRVDPSNASRP